MAIWKIEETEDFFLQKVSPPPSIKNTHKRLQHLAGRWLLQYLFPDFPYNKILIADTKKPYLPEEEYHFSISHCADYAAAIVSRNKRVGIDVEVSTEKVEKIMHKFLNNSELSFIQSATQFIPLLTMSWCAKEAVFKWWSYGGVDFSEHILLSAYELAKHGIIDAQFCKAEYKFILKLHYKMLCDLCLVWIAE